MIILKNNLPKLDARFLFSHPAHFIALGFGTGLSRVAPGTAGTLVGFLLFWLLSCLSPVVFWIVSVLLIIAGIWVCDRTGRDLGVADHGGIVWDEIVAFMLVLFFTPPTLGWFTAAFAFFRLFDIWKPFPIRYVDRTVKGGIGVMLDDVLAAGYAIAAIEVIRSVAENRSIDALGF